MATAVKPTQEIAPRTAHQQLLSTSLLGAAYVLFSLWLLLAGLPALWKALDLANVLDPFLADSLLLLVTLAVAPALLLLGKAMEGSHPVPGARAGAFILAFLFVLALLITAGIGNGWFASVGMEPTVGIILTATVALGLLFVLARIAFKPGFGQWLVGVEESGWFHATSYKPNQGLRVRRGTVLGLLIVGACGIYVLISGGTLSSGNWEVALPFSQGLTEPPEAQATFIMMHKVNMVLPVVLMIALLWFSWRVVNWPKFADFLIATEAEMNKVSWTTRKRLFQDTVVVLVTVVLLTTFLFIVDILWIRILSNPVLRVLDVDPMEERARQKAPTQW